MSLKEGDRCNCKMTVYTEKKRYQCKAPNCLTLKTDITEIKEALILNRDAKV